MKNFYQKFDLASWQEEIFAMLIFVVSLSLLKFFPSQNSLGQNLTGFVFALALLPYLFSKFIIKKSLESFGWHFVSWKENAKWIIGTLLLSFLIGFGLTFWPLVKENYFINVLVAKYFWAFVFYELIIINILTFLEVSFFQGFVLFSFKEKLGKFSLLLSLIGFMLYLFLMKGFDWSIIPFIGAFALTSFLTFKIRSFFWSYLIILVLHIAIDAYFISAIH